MTVSNKFNFESKQKMKKMIELSKDGIEYFTIIKKDYTLGEITKGKKGYCEPVAMIESNKDNVIGLFHTHPHDKDFFTQSEKQDEQLDILAKIMNTTEGEKALIRKETQNKMVETSAYMSPNDLRFSLAYNLIIECIGTTDKEGKPIVLCFEVYSDAKERMIKKINTLHQKEKELFLMIFTAWMNNEKIENQDELLLEMYVFMRLLKWAIKEKNKIDLSDG